MRFDADSPYYLMVSEEGKEYAFQMEVEYHSGVSISYYCGLRIFLCFDLSRCDDLYRFYGKA